MAGGNSVVITGTGFKVGAVDVTLGVTFGPNETGGNCTADLATQITCPNVPAGTGTVSVQVTTAGGTTADTAADDYIYAPVPTITALSVAGGPEAGGNAVTISGTGFKVGTVDVVTGVTFGGTAATCTTNSATEVACTAPAGTGLVDVFVTTFGGTGDALDSYAYAPTPTVTGLSPASGTSAGGTAVAVTGTGFKVASVDVVTGVTFGGTAAVCTTATSTTLNCTSPAHAATLATVTVTTFGGSSPDNTPFDKFLYS